MRHATEARNDKKLSAQMEDGSVNLAGQCVRVSG